MSLEPLDPVLAALFRVERDAVAMDPRVASDAVGRAMLRADALLAAAPDLGAPDAGAAAGASAGFGLGALGAALASGAAAGALATYVALGGAPPANPPPPIVGSTVDAPPPVDPPARSATTLADVPPTASAPAVAPSPPSALAVAPAPPSAAAPSAASRTDAPTGDDLVREREMVDAARAALARGNVGEASRILREHDARFPKAQLGEERDALAIVALARSGKRDEAQSRLPRFRARFPSSRLTPMLEAETRGLDAPP